MRPVPRHGPATSLHRASTTTTTTATGLLYFKCGRGTGPAATCRLIGGEQETSLLLACNVNQALKTQQSSCRQDQSAPELRSVRETINTYKCVVTKTKQHKQMRGTPHQKRPTRAGQAPSTGFETGARPPAACTTGDLQLCLGRFGEQATLKLKLPVKQIPGPSHASCDWLCFCMHSDSKQQQ